MKCQRCIRNGLLWAINRQTVPYFSVPTIHIPRDTCGLLRGANELYLVLDLWGNAGGRNTPTNFQKF
jgi:hypothetical protein